MLVRAGRALAGAARPPAPAVAGAEEQSPPGQLAALLEINTKLGACRSVPALATEIAAEAARLLDVDDTSLRLVDGAGLRLAGTAGAAAPAAQCPGLARDEGFMGQVAEAGRSLAGELPPPECRDGRRWLLGVPLRVGGQVTGVLAFRGRRPFTAHQRELAEAFAGQAAIGLEHARLLALETGRRAQIEALAEIERELAAELHVDRLLRLIVDHADRLFEGEGAIYLASDAALVPRATSAPDLFARPLAIGQGLAGACAQTRRGLVANDYPRWPHALPAFVERGLQHGMTSPLLVRDRLLGVIAMGRRGTGARPFTPDDLDALARFATQAAIALANAELHEEAQRRRQEAEHLAGLARRLTETLDVASVGQRLVESVLPLFGADASGLRLREPDGSLRILVFEGHGCEHFHPTAVLPPGIGVSGRAVEEGAAAWSADVLDDPKIVLTAELREALEAAGHRAVLAVPLRVKGEVMGALTLAHRARRAFSDHEVALLETLAAQAGLALDHARLYADTARRLEQTRALLDVVQILNSTLDQTQLLKRVAIRIAQVCRVDRCTLERLEDGRLVPLMSQFADGHEDPAMWAAFTRMPPSVPAEVPLQARVLETRGPAIVDDVAASTELPREWVEAFGHKSYMSVPIVRQDELVGLLTLDQVRRVTPFEPWQVDLAQAIAGQLALSLENTRLFSEAQERLRETSTLLAVGQALSQPAPLAEQMRRVARATGAALDADTVGVYVLDESRERLQPLAGWRVPDELRERFRRHPIVPARQPILEEAWRSGRAVGSGDPQNDERFDRAWSRLFPPHSVLLAPTHAHGQSVGALFLVWWTTGRAFSAAESRLVEGVAAQVGLALENAQLARQREIKLQETETLLSVSRALSSTLDLDALLRQLLRRLARTVGADTVGVLRLAEDGRTLLPWAGYRVPIDRLEGLRHELRLSIAEHAFYAEAARTRRPVFSPDVAADPRMPEIIGRLLPHRSQLFVPIVAKDRLIGGFVAFWRERAGDFSAGDLALMEAIAQQAGAAVDNARLFEERTRAYQELSAAQDHLVRTEKLRALGEMASGVAHDFNNLLAAILGRAQLLLRRLHDPDLRQWAQVIERSALDGAQAIRRLQEFARIRRDSPMVPVDLNEVVRDALEITQARWGEDALQRGAPVEVRTALAAVSPIAGDAAELREALTNLILNALDAMPGGGRLTLTTAPIEDGRAVEVAIADTGTGMPADVRERIFDPFFTTKGPQGTGLGLSMTYGIVSRFRGAITVESEEGRGSTFRLRFPAVPGPAAAAEAALPAGSPPGRLRCLVVDDEPMVGAVIGDVLQALGHEAVVLTDGGAAVERCAAEPFDAVFTDLAMPGVSGWQVAAAIRARAADVAIFVVTGFGVEIPQADERAHGVDRIFAKPLRIEDVKDALAQLAVRRVAPLTAPPEDA